MSYFLPGIKIILVILVLYTLKICPQLFYPKKLFIVALKIQYIHHQYSMSEVLLPHTDQIFIININIEICEGSLEVHFCQIKFLAYI